MKGGADNLSDISLCDPGSVELKPASACLKSPTKFQSSWKSRDRGRETRGGEILVGVMEGGRSLRAQTFHLRVFAFLSENKEMRLCYCCQNPSISSSCPDLMVCNGCTEYSSGGRARSEASQEVNNTENMMQQQLPDSVCIYVGSGRSQNRFNAMFPIHGNSGLNVNVG